MVVIVWSVGLVEVGEGFADVVVGRPVGVLANLRAVRD